MKKMKLDIQLFNGSCSIQSITETTNINTNQSTFTITAKTSVTGATYNGQKGAYMTAQWKYASASEWTSLTQQKFSISKESSVTKSWDLILDHNADGTLENINVRIKWYVTSSTNGTTGATNVTPTTIPRASIPTLSSSSVNMGSSVTIYTNRYSSSFTHTIRYAFGNANGTIASNVATSTSWTPPLTLANQIPSATSGVGIIYCDTYNGSTLIGTKTINITLNVPSSIVPSTSFTQVQEAGSVPSSWGIYVKSKSKVALAISGSGSYGSSISSYKISYYGGAVTTSSATTSFLTQSGNTTFTGQVTDTRGRSASTTTTINVVDYSNPTISTAQVQRCDASGNIDNNGEYMYISYGASISSCSSKNTPSAVYKVGYRVHNTGNYTYVNLTTNANSYSASGVLFTDGIKASSSSGTKVQFSTNNTYDIQFYVKDYFMEYTNVQSLDAGFDLMNFNASGKAMAIGKVSEAGANEELLEIGLRTKFYEPIKDILVVDKIRTNNILNTYSFIKGRITPNSSGGIVNESGTTSLSTTDNSITFTVNAAWNSGVASGFIPVETGTYTYSATSDKKVFYYVDTYNSSKTWISRILEANGNGSVSRSFTIGSGVAYIRFHYEVDNVNTFTITNPQIEKGSTATTFYPYQDLDTNNIGYEIPQNDFLNLNNGYAIVHYFIYKTSNSISGTIVARSYNTAFANSNQIPFTIKSGYRPITSYYTFCGLGIADWNIRRVGYSYFGRNGDVVVVDLNNSGDCYYATLTFNYLIGQN